jgi:hypothetical protein
VVKRFTLSFFLVKLISLLLIAAFQNTQPTDVTTEPVVVKTDQSPGTKSSQPSKAPVSVQQTSTHPAVKNSTVSNPINTTQSKVPSYSSATSSSPGFQSTATVTVGGFQNPDAIIRQYKVQNAAQFASLQQESPQDRSPTVQEQDRTSKEKSLSPPPPPPPPVSASESLGSPQTLLPSTTPAAMSEHIEPPATVHVVEKSSSSPFDQFVLAFDSPNETAVKSHHGILDQPLGNQEAGSVGGQQDSASHTSSHAVGFKVPHQAGSKDGVSNGQQEQNRENVKLAPEAQKVYVLVL